eukprot:3190934-Alexandrium_andersonii.AAC.1
MRVALSVWACCHLRCHAARDARARDIARCMLHAAVCGCANDQDAARAHTRDAHAHTQHAARSTHTHALSLIHI